MDGVKVRNFGDSIRTFFDEERAVCAPTVVPITGKPGAVHETPSDILTWLLTFSCAA